MLSFSAFGRLKRPFFVRRDPVGSVKVNGADLGAPAPIRHRDDFSLAEPFIQNRVHFAFARSGGEGEKAAYFQVTKNALTEPQDDN